eukprot:gene8066-biopygen4606
MSLPECPKRAFLTYFRKNTNKYTWTWSYAKCAGKRHFGGHRGPALMIWHPGVCQPGRLIHPPDELKLYSLVGTSVYHPWRSSHVMRLCPVQESGRPETLTKKGAGFTPNGCQVVQLQRSPVAAFAVAYPAAALKRARHTARAALHDEVSSTSRAHLKNTSFCQPDGLTAAAEGTQNTIFCGHPGCHPSCPLPSAGCLCVHRIHAKRPFGCSGPPKVLQ